MHRPALLFALLVVPAALSAQSVTAEGTETVRLKPDHAKVSLFVTGRGKNAEQADEKAADAAKDLADDVSRLKLKGVSAEIDPAAVPQEPLYYPPGGPTGPVIVSEPRVVRRVVVTVADADAKALMAAVEKVQREGAKYGTPADPPRVIYSRSDAADDGTAAALGKATKKATARAEAIAGGLGLKLGAATAADEVPVPDSVADGEVVRTVKVRVVYGVTK